MISRKLTCCCPLKFWLLLLIGLSSAAPRLHAAPRQTYPPAVQALLDWARANNPQHYQFALDQGAQIGVTADQRSFYLVWYPATQTGLPADKRSLIVTMHGTGGNAFTEFFLWYNSAQQHQHGVLALQWYFPANTPPNDYYAPAESYSALAAALKGQAFKPGRALFHGFSRGSANSYYVTMFDRLSGNHFFGLSVANSGGASTDYPLYLDIVAGRFGVRPLAGTRWITSCGERDPNPERDGCPALRRTDTWLLQQGASLDMVIEDNAGGHGVFEQVPRYLDAALTLFENLLSVGKQVWTAKPDTSFRIANANIPNVGLVNYQNTWQIWLIVGGQGGLRLFRSANGDNATNGEAIPGLASAFAGTGFTATETLPRVSGDGKIELYSLGLAGPGTNQAVLYRLRQNDNGTFSLNPANAVWRGAAADNQFIGVPDVYATNDGKLRLMYVARGTARSNARTALSSDGGQTFAFEYENPYNDLNVTTPSAENTNVDPAVLKLAAGGFLSVTMRAKRLYLHASTDGRVFTPLQQAALDAAQLFANGTGFFDPTLVQTMDGRVWMYVTLETLGGVSSVVRVELIQAAPLAAVSAASFKAAALAPDSIAAIFGANLTNATAAANTTPLPTTLAGSRAKLRDSLGVEREAGFFFVSPTQANLLLPGAAATGLATLTLTNSDNQTSANVLNLTPVAPALFTANASGQGVPAAVLLRIQADGARSFEPVARYDAAQNRFVAQPIEFGAAGDQLFLLLFGTGIRGRTSLANVTATAGGVNVPVGFAGAQGDLAGLDQINLELPRALAGRGELEVSVIVEGQECNVVTIRVGN
ncbi:MAG: hypothetical protein HYR56_19220 [Acidobacteria bacterium]|nr:hypothetical protein [Acidobacteriota bacterium]MBI3421684.1 hypothetical protein [Acidobacteriota bacterium]